MKQKPILYLIPSNISEAPLEEVLPDTVIKRIHQLRHFIAERAKTARQFIKATNPPYKIQDIAVEELNKHQDYALPKECHDWMKACHDIGMLSEAGSPCVADPGFHVVTLARSYAYQIKPLTGPNSMLLTLMASGLNGQGFTFHGYLPVDQKDLKHKLRSMEAQTLQTGHSQLFIETPYRNQKLFDLILQTLSARIRLCIGVDLTSEMEQVETYSIKEWKGHTQKMNLHRRPAVFIIGV